MGSGVPLRERVITHDDDDDDDDDDSYTILWSIVLLVSYVRNGR